MRKNSWKPIFLILFIFIGIIWPAGLTNAFFTDRQQIRNRLHAAVNTTSVEEEFDPPVLQPGENRYLKKIAVRNTGTTGCFVRVFLAFSDSRCADVTGIAPTQGDMQAGIFYPENEFRQHLPAGWRYDASDGYYYYVPALLPGEVTNPLMYGACTVISPEDDIREFDIIVYEESVQMQDDDGVFYSGQDAWRQAWEAYAGDGA